MLKKSRFCAVTLTCALSFSTSCAKKEEDQQTVASSATAEDQTGAQDQESSDISLENSEELLRSHVEDLRQLEEEASALGESDIEQNASILATTYDFTVRAKVNEGKYREAQFEWDKAETNYKAMELAYGKITSDELTSAWQQYLGSRATMIKLKAKWSQN